MAEEKIPAKNQLRKCLSVSVRLCLSVCLSFETEVLSAYIDS